MLAIKKYLALTVLLLALPIAAFIGTHFVLEADKSIYSYIPQESDVVIEINTRNFISEVMFQRIYNEEYFNSKIVPEETDQEFKDVGIDPFTSIIFFREQWADHDIWMALAGYSNRTQFEQFIAENLPASHLEFGDKFVLVQLNPYHDQAKLDEHMKDIMAGKIESFSKRVDLSEIFDRTKEINCYILPQTTLEENKLLNGYLSLDFQKDQISISGEFTPVSGFSENAPVAYALNEDAAFSMRSSLNLLNSLYWFSDEKIQGIPMYSQLALDYDGMNMFMVHKNLGYLIPFKQYPIMQAHFEIIDRQTWQEFFDTLQASKFIKADTVTHILSTNSGVFLNYKFNQSSFELMRDTVNLVRSKDDKLYFAFQFHVDPLLANTKFAIDEQNPPAEIEQELGLMVANEMLDEMRLMTNIEDIRFELRLKDETNLIADGKITMVEKNGNSMIESMSFGMASLIFMTEYLSSVPEED